MSDSIQVFKPKYVGRAHLSHIGFSNLTIPDRKLCTLGSWRLDSFPKEEVRALLEKTTCRRCTRLALRSLS